MSAFDYIIVGAGTAGCLLANRLSADPRNNVLLIEAGRSYASPWAHIPAGYLHLIGNPRTDWCYTTEPEPALGGRQLAYARGKIPGGSSAINAMIYMRGHKANYDAWAQAGNEGWSWDDVLPYFLRHEDHFQPDENHQAGGEWRVEAQRVHWPVLDAGLAGFSELGVPRISDFNTGDNLGASYFHVSQRGGVRVHAAKAFLDPVRRRPNLAVLTGAQATRILLEQKRALGVRYMHGEKQHEAHARQEVILASGAINTPHLLELSGVGAPERLVAAGIAPVHALPGVGENLIDHLQIRTIFRVDNAATLNTLAASLIGKASIFLNYLLRRRGPLAMAPSQAGAFLHSSTNTGASPDLHVNLQPLSLDRFGAPLHPFPAITVSIANVQPESRGGVHATGPDFRTPPAIRPNYLATAGDRSCGIEAVRLARRLMATVALAPNNPAEYSPGPAAETDEEILKSLGGIAGTLFHPCGSARMGTDPHAAVDSSLKVVGIDGLRVVDASVIPAPISGGLSAPTLMIAEKGADMILNDLKRRRTASKPHSGRLSSMAA